MSSPMFTLHVSCAGTSSPPKLAYGSCSQAAVLSPLSAFSCCVLVFSNLCTLTLVFIVQVFEEYGPHLAAPKQGMLGDPNAAKTLLSGSCLAQLLAVRGNAKGKGAPEGGEVVFRGKEMCKQRRRGGGRGMPGDPNAA